MGIGVVGGLHDKKSWLPFLYKLADTTFFERMKYIEDTSHNTHRHGTGNNSKTIVRRNDDYAGIGARQFFLKSK